jgi:hypothetical protein
MSNDNYPAGVTDAHPYFNPDERPVTVECTEDEALVVPSFFVKENLSALLRLAQNMEDGYLTARIEVMLEQITELEKEGGYECEWTGELDLPVSPEAEWDCPRCGVTQTTDTLPDDGYDDDYYDRMKDARYDD